MKFAETLFEIAKKDLEAANCLFERELYPQAVFYLQQSVEKATKSFGNISEKDAKKIGHKSIEVYKKLLEEEKKKLENLEKTIEKFPELQKTKIVGDPDLGTHRKKLDNSLKLLPEINRKTDYIFTKEMIKNLIELLNEIKSLPTPLYIISEQESEEAKRAVEEVLDVFYNGYPEKVKEAKQKLNTFWHSDLKEQMIKEIGRNLVDCIYVSHSLEILSIIMTPFHAINTRYPTKEHNPLEYYNDNLPFNTVV